MSKLLSNEFEFTSEALEKTLIVSLDYKLNYDIDKCGYSLEVFAENENGEWRRLNMFDLNSNESVQVERMAELHFDKVVGELHQEYVDDVGSLVRFK